MPYKAARPCGHPRCGTLVTDGSGYCAAHQSDRKRFNADDRPSASQRGYGAAWRKLRDQVMRRDNGLCQVCQRAGRITAAAQVDHIVPKAEGGTDDEGNLQAICKRCHQIKTGREGAIGKVYGHESGSSPRPRQDPVIGCNTDGVPLSPGHHWNRPQKGG